ncbi:MAG: Sialic acid TRAP transporter permease protein SiaT [Synergistetes bacterium ADurb.Bin155]|jgi:tripartite ATP-independent transporter DctM subunit|nr:TRAP transporter large permease [Synergistales bacterium]MBP8995308.1 TRAP transporter large permease [Synergistales bacterium]OQB46150.1 MAG: Sialic acid TRAP transporter permease protein SiaT [Synergistetes bacterium ADurb.Bin155]HOC81818.1 TRAP transporter large permease [Synergistales bacterium]HQL02398.1 TRAP transporter large permease [Synergistales bacterium]
MVIAINLVILISLIVAGLPVPFCFMTAAIYMGIVYNFSFSFLLPGGYYALNSLTLLSVPFFIMAGTLMSSSGIAERLTDFAQAFLGRMRGGMGAATIVACAIFGAISGTCSSAVACIGGIMIPRLEKLGYPRYYSVALVGCASVLGQLIPPSVPMILYAWVTQQSVAACFLATVIPGILTTFLMCVVNWFEVKKIETVRVEPQVPFTQKIQLIGRATKRGIWSLLMPVIILGGIYGGITTPTESAAIAVFYGILVGFLVHRELTPKVLGRALVDSSTTTGVCVLMLFFVSILAKVYTMQRIPQQLADFMMTISENKMVLLLLVNVFLLIIGMLMDDFSGTMLSAPLLLPLMVAIGVHPVHFAAIMGTNLGLGNVTPPCAPILYLAGRIGGASIDEYFKPALKFMIFAQVPVILLTTYIPGLSMWLPRLVMGVQ